MLVGASQATKEIPIIQMLMLGAILAPIFSPLTPLLMGLCCLGYWFCRS